MYHWKAQSVELQAADDRHDLKALKTVYGPSKMGSIPVRSVNDSLLTDNIKIREHWAQHFQVVPNQLSDFNTSIMDELPQLPTASHLDKVPTRLLCSLWTMFTSLIQSIDCTKCPVQSMDWILHRISSNILNTVVSSLVLQLYCELISNVRVVVL